MRALVLIVTLMLSGCITFPTTLDLPAPTPTKPNIDKRLLEECPPLGDLKENPEPADVVLQHGEDVKMYSECRDSKSKLIEIIKAAFE